MKDDKKRDTTKNCSKEKKQKTAVKRLNEKQNAHAATAHSKKHCARKKANRTFVEVKRKY